MDQIATASGGQEAPGTDFIHIHRNWMVSVMTIGILLSIYLFWINKKKKWTSQRWGLLLGLLLMSIVLTLGVDSGHRLVFEFGKGVNPKVLKVTTEGNKHSNEH